MSSSTTASTWMIERRISKALAEIIHPLLEDLRRRSQLDNINERPPPATLRPGLITERSELVGRYETQMGYATLGIILTDANVDETTFLGTDDMSRSMNADAESIYARNLERLIGALSGVSRQRFKLLPPLPLDYKDWTDYYLIQIKRPVNLILQPDLWRDGAIEADFTAYIKASYAEGEMDTKDHGDDKDDEEAENSAEDDEEAENSAEDSKEAECSAEDDEEAENSAEDSEQAEHSAEDDV